jgi:large repetitive protein
MQIAAVAPRSIFAGLACLAAVALLACGQPEATPTSVTFPDATVSLPSTKQLTIKNIAESGALTLKSTKITGPDAKMFGDRFQDGTVVILQPGESTTIPVVFLPSAPGSRSATLSIDHSGAGSPMTIPLSGNATVATGGTGPSFGKSVLAGADVVRPTSLQFGPDGRLYVAQMDGTIKALSVERRGPDKYAVTAAETITLVRSIPNHDDNGTLNPSLTTRQLTGILVTGTAASPQIYAVSTDPRAGGGAAGTDTELDTNSGILSRLTKVGGTWQKVDLVRGLPRSEENHAGNGMVIDPATGKLLIAYGGNTNKGAPSHNFAFLPETALSAAVLSVDLNAIGGSTYDVPTLDDENRPGAADAGDPFGGNNGKNQARVVPGGPVQIYSPGYRNPYDLVVTQSGQMYTIDNAGNAGWGGIAQPDDTAGACDNAPVDTSDSDTDALMHITGPGFYGGHANPTRANRANTFNSTNPQTPVPSAHPVECDYRNEAERGALTTFPFSTNGIDEYTASNFGSAMKGDLVAAVLGGSINRLRLSADGGAVTSNTPMFSSLAAPLDVVAQGDSEPFAGTIWVVNFLDDTVMVFEPDDFPCVGADNPNVDEDGDGFDNADEIDNNTNQCSSADTPPDADSDKRSDLNDPDDDNDGLPDTSDPFAVDAANGANTPLPVEYTWDTDAPAPGGLLGVGFTGLMTNGSTDYRNLFDATKMTAGGVAGVVTVDEVGDGDALGSANNQQYAFQHGIDVTNASGPFVVHTSLPAPFSGAAAPSGAQSYGVFVGTGGQDSYVKLTVAANAGAGGFALVKEQGGTPTTITQTGPQWPGPSVVDLYLRVDPAAGTVRASYSIEGAAAVAIGGTQSVPTSWFSGATRPAVGIISTSAGPAPPFPATWDLLEVHAAPSGPAPSTTVEAGSAGLNSSTFNAGSFRIANASTAGQQIASVRLDLSSSLLPDLVFDPNGNAGDTLGKGFTVDSNPGVGTIGHSFTGTHDSGFEVLNATFTDFGPGETLTFSADIDPTSIRGVTAPGPNEAGSVSGLELAGAAVTVTYEDGTSETGRLYRTAGSTGQSEAHLDGVGRAAPSIAVVGVPDLPATVSGSAQTIRVSGPSGAAVRLLRVESGLFTAGLPGGGFDLDPFEANSIVGVTEQTATIGAGGSVDIPVTLTSTVAGGGNNRFVAVVAAAGATGPTSNLAVLQLGSAGP